MQKCAFFLASASLFAFAPLASRFGPLVTSVALVWSAILLAVFASGTLRSMAVTAGALGALGGGVIAGSSPAIAGAVVVGAAFAERTTRVRTRNGKAIHVLMALVSGALAGSLSNAFSGASITVFVVAIVVGAVLTGLPLIVEADDAVAHALDLAAGSVSEPAKSSLARAADLRRQVSDVPMDRAAATRLRTTWNAILRLAEARVRLERTAFTTAPGSPTSAVAAMVDQRLADHATVLARAYSAVDTARAAELGLDDVALKNVEALGDSLEDVSRALVEVDGPRAAT